MVKVHIPASSANIGVGFDVAGLSLSLFNTIDFSVSQGPLIIEQVTPNDAIPCDATNLVYVAAVKTAEILGKKLPPLHLRQYNRIPMASGLGSSAACIVGGILIADNVLQADLSKKEMLEIATALEGHPDNAAPVLYGGFCISRKNGNAMFTHRIPLKEDLAVCIAVPKLSLKTKDSRKVLPALLPMVDAVNNIACMALLISALYSGEYTLLDQALEDRLHQPYRKHFIPGFDDIVQAARRLGAYGACLSGAGPSMITFVNKKKLADFTRLFGDALKGIPGEWRVIPVELDKTGAYIENV